MAIRVRRTALQVLGAAPPTVGARRLDLETAATDQGATGAARVGRVAVQVLAKSPAQVQAHRVEVEAASSDAGSTGTARVVRAAVQVIAKAPSHVGAHRLDLDAATTDAGSTGKARVRRVVAQILARSGVAPPTPLAFPANLDWFLHNWASSFVLESEFLSDVSRSGITGAEERRSLRQRPVRTVTVNWLRDEVAEVDRVLNRLRRMTRERTAVPLFADAVLVDQESTSVGADATWIFCEARHRRFYTGGRVAVLPLTGTYHERDTIDLYTVDATQSDRIRVTSTLARTYAAKRWVVVPLIDVEQVLEVGALHLTDDTIQVAIDMREVNGPSALPPAVAGGIPDGWQEQLGLPVFELDPDWSEGIRTRFVRYGEERREGRADEVIPTAPRYVQIQHYSLPADRETFWRVLQLFESRRGRTGTFFEVDKEHVWKVVDTDPTFVDIEPIGRFADFRDDFTDHLGIVMEDGTVFVRTVNTFSDNGSTWRITLAGGESLPAIDVSQVRRFSRARVKRFTTDVLREEWLTNTVCLLEFETVEVLGEAP